MDSLSELLRRLLVLVRRQQFDADLEEEMRLHLELREQEQIQAGLSSREARQAASRRFGNATLLMEKSHMAWGWEWFESFVQDTAYGSRAMLRSPALTIVALLSLALGIGANTAIFSLLDAVMLRSLPVRDPAQLVLLGKGNTSGITDDFARTQLYSYPFYRQMRGEEPSLFRHRRHLQHDERRPRLRRGKSRIRTDERPARLRHVLHYPRRKSTFGPHPERCRR